MSLDALTAIWRSPPCKGGDLLCLLAIADNADDYGYAWPSIKTISRKAAMSERGAQKCLRKLEDAGLIIVEIGGGRGSSNSYQITTNGMGENVSHKNPEQGSPNRVHPLGGENPEQSNIKGEQNDAKPRTPVHPNPIEPSIEQYCAADAPHDHFDFGSFFNQVWRAYPNKGSWAETESAVLELIDAGEKPDDILAATKAYATKTAGYDQQRIKLSQNFFADDFWKKHIPPRTKPVDPKTILAARADEIRSAKPWVKSTISAHKAGECIAAGLVTPAECHAAGINV